MIASLKFIDIKPLIMIGHMTFIQIKEIRMSQKIKSNITLGHNLRKLRKERKITQEQMVARMQLLGINISRSIYSQIECGTYNIKVTELAALKTILDVDYNTLFQGISYVDNGKRSRINSGSFSLLFFIFHVLSPRKLAGIGDGSFKFQFSLPLSYK